MMARKFFLMGAATLAALLLSGCPKGQSEYKAGQKAEQVQDLDTALIHYQKALQEDPRNVDYKLKATRLRFEASQQHVNRGQKYRDKGELQLAVAEFEKAAAFDPSSVIATQELRATLEMLRVATGAAPSAAQGAAAGAAPQPPLLAEGPPQLKPLTRDPINLRVTNDARVVFESVAKLAGISVLFDADFQARRISTDLTNVTLEEALDVIALQSKAFWKPVTGSVIMVVPDNPQKRKDFEDQVVKTFYLGNTVQPTDLTEITNMLRQVVDLRKVQQINSQNAIVIRDTPDKIALIEKLLADVDKAKPEVIVQVSVLSARTDRLRQLGILPGSSSVLAFTPRNPTSSGSGSNTATNQLRLNDLQRLASSDYSITLPGAAANALITDSATKIIQNPEIRAMDGQSAKLRVGDRVPIATGSFQAGVGVGGSTATGVINPLVNTQFQYQDVGVNVDFTPRVHAATREVSLKISIEVSAVTGRQSIGGIDQPIISQQKIEHDVRLREGEVNVLGGLVKYSENKSLEGWPGLSRIPLLRYFFSSEKKEIEESEVLIILTPRIVRLPEINPANFRSVGTGTETNIQVKREEGQKPATANPPPAPQSTPQPPPAQKPPAGEQEKVARLRFEPGAMTLKPGATATIGIVIEDVKDLAAIPLMLQYNPAVISVEEVRHATGGFLSGGTQDVAIVQRIEKEKGQAIISATRQPNTPGVSGAGTLVSIVIKAVAPGSSQLQVLQVLARNSQGAPIAVVSSEGTVRVQ
jgi:general secretion pathway protein D